ncbi:MAG: dTDP-4-dehydrorhamnose 3,5-epimerase [Streptosporangiaceae bacterium]
MEALTIEGTYVFTPRIHGDARGSFLEWFKEDQLTEIAGHGLKLSQANCSTSGRGVLRGIHFADVPPGQAKYVTCVSGTVLDVVVDLRTGSPTFGRWDSVRLDDQTRRAVYLSEGLGHGFLTLSESATVVYLCSESYNPGHEHGVHPLDPDLAIDWPLSDLALSVKDETAPSLAEALHTGLLPSYEECQAFYATLR